MFATKVGGLSRNIATSAARLYQNPSRGPGSNLPFKLDNHYKLTAIFTFYVASGIAIPFLTTRHQLLK